jgi:RNA polymerase sigma-70 factor (ECF subfamily)
MIPAMTQLVLSDAFVPHLDAARAYECYGRFLWRTLYRLGVREADLPDALQDVLVVVHKRGAGIDATAGVTTWLFGVCRRVAAAHRRKAYTRREVPDADADSIELDDPERLTVTRRAKLRLERVLDGVADDHRVVFVMFEIEGLSCPEIAAELAVPIGTIYSRLYAARQSFQKSLTRMKSKEESAVRRSHSRSLWRGEP